MKTKLYIYTLSIFTLYFFLSAFQQPQIDNKILQKDTIKASQLLQEEKLLKEKGNYKAAFSVVEQAQALYIKHKQWEAVIKCIIRLSELSDFLDATEIKIEQANLAIKLGDKYLPKNHPLFASVYRQKAETFMLVGNLDSANYFLNQAIPIFEKNKDWTNLSWSELFIGINALNQYHLDLSESHLGVVQNLLHEHEFSPIDRLDIQVTLFSILGVLYELYGDYEKAIQITKAALAVDLNKLTLTKEDSLYITQHYRNLGAFYLVKGDYQRALDNSMQAIAYHKSSLYDSFFLNNVGELFQRQERYDEAVTYFQKSLQITKKQSNLKAQINSFNGLGIAFRELEKYDSSLMYCQEALKLPIEYRKFITWTIIGNINIQKKEPQKAIEHLDIALATYKKDSTASLQSSFYIPRLYRLFGDAHFINQDLNAALTFYQKALISNHTNFKDSLNYNLNPSLTGIYNPIHFLKALRGKAKTQAALYYRPAQLKNALVTYQLTIQWIDSLQTSYSSEASHLDWSGKYKQIYEEAIGVTYQLYQNTQDQKYLDMAFSISEKGKNAILLEALKATEGKSYASVPNSLLQKEKDLRLDIAFYEKSMQKAKEKKDTAKTELYQNYLSKNRLDLVNLQERLEKDYPKFHDLKYGGEIMSIATVQSKLVDDDSALLEYFVGDSTTYVFLISKNSAEMLALPKPAELAQLVTRFRAVLLDYSSFMQNAKAAFKNYNEKAVSVYQHILQPAIDILPSNVERLIIIPDAFLNTLPLEALTKNIKATASSDFAQLDYLLFDYQFQYAYSADLLLKNKTRNEQLPANSACLAFAPSYKNNSPIALRGNLSQLRNTTESLEGTILEIEQISRFFEGQFNIGASATKQQFKESANQFGILHLAMHGVPDFDNANFNHLIFSNLRSDSSADNLLHHYEIANMDLNAQLVVLSACETGIGKYEKGEGVYSLARSFMYAGVPSVVMSLWKVSDQSTSKLMPYFYENLSNGQTKDMALQEAKKRFLKDAGLEHRHPFFWSAFVQLGDVQKIKTAHIGFTYWGIGGIFLAIMGYFFWRNRED